MLDQSYYQKADEIIAFYGKKPSSLIPVMQDIQGVYRYLPGELLTYIAKEIWARSSSAIPGERTILLMTEDVTICRIISGSRVTGRIAN